MEPTSPTPVKRGPGRPRKNPVAAPVSPAKAPLEGAPGLGLPKTASEPSPNRIDLTVTAFAVAPLRGKWAPLKLTVRGGEVVSAELLSLDLVDYESLTYPILASAVIDYQREAVGSRKATCQHEPATLQPTQGRKVEACDLCGAYRVQGQDQWCVGVPRG